MEPTPDREENMPTAAPEQIGSAPAYEISEDGGDLVIRIPTSVVTRDRLERLLDRIQFEHLGGRSQPAESVAELAGKVRHAVRERIFSHTRAAANVGEHPDDPAVGPNGQAGMDDQLEQLYFMTKVERGLRQIDTGRFVSHEEAKRRFGR